MNWSPGPVALVPSGVVTVMSTEPALPCGLVAVSCVALATFTLVAWLAPKWTDVLPEMNLCP